MTTKRRATLELLESAQELAATTPRHHDDAGAVDVVAAAILLGVVADLGIRRDDVETIHDAPAEARALAHRGVVHHDRILDHGPFVHPHAPAEDRVAHDRPLDERALADLAVVDVAADEARGRPRVRAGADRPLAVVEVEAGR